MLKGLPTIEGRPGALMAPLDFTSLKSQLVEEHGSRINDYDTVSSAMYPKVTDDFLRFRERYGPVDKLDTRIFLTGPKVGEEFEVEIEKGKTLHIKTLAMAEDLNANGEREVFFELNGQLRSVMVRDQEAMKELHVHPKVTPGVKGEVGAPMPGTVVDIQVKVGDVVKKGSPLVVLSAMKMEMVVQAPCDGKVASISVTKDMKLEGDDLVLSLDPQ